VSLPGQLTSGTALKGGGVTGRTALAKLPGATSSGSIGQRTLASPVSKLPDRITSTRITSTGRISNLDSDSTSLERLSIESKSLLQALNGGKLNIAKPLGSLKLTVLDETDADDVAAGEEIRHGIVGNIISQVSQVSGIGRLVGDLLRRGLADREAPILPTGGRVVVTRAVAWGQGLSAGDIGFLNLISPRASTTKTVSQKVPKGHLLLFLLLRSHDCG
jgi:hypothetical protein